MSKREKTRKVIMTALRISGMLVCVYGLLCAILPIFVIAIFNLATVALIVLSAPTLYLLAVPNHARKLYFRLKGCRLGKALLYAVCIGLSVAAVYSVAVSTVMLKVCNAKPPQDDASVCIVLGCKISGEYEPSPMLEGRLRTAVKFLESHPEAVCIVSGGQGDNEDFAEAVVMRNWLVREGISEERILLERESRNTEENIRFSSEVLKENGLGEKVVIITDWWHQLRASVWAQKCGLQSYAVSAENPEISVKMIYPLYYVRELLGMLRIIAIGK